LCTSSTGYYLSTKICTNHHQTHISCNIHITYMRQNEENKSFCRKSGQICGIKNRHTCLEVYGQTNVGLLCCVSYGSSVAVPSITPHSVKLLWTCHWPVAETATFQHTTVTETSMPQVEFKPAITAREQLQTHALDHVATGTGLSFL
jgi:hypothetical protein